MFTNLPRKFEQLSDHLVTGQLQLLASFDIEVPHSSASPDQVSLNSPLTSFPDPRALREKLAIKRNLLLLYQIVVFGFAKDMSIVKISFVLVDSFSGLYV